MEVQKAGGALRLTSVVCGGVGIASSGKRSRTGGGEGVAPPEDPSRRRVAEALGGRLRFPVEAWAWPFLEGRLGRAPTKRCKQEARGGRQQMSGGGVGMVSSGRGGGVGACPLCGEAKA